MSSFETNCRYLQLPKITDQELHSKHIAPYYMDLMNLNFLNKSDNEIEELFNSLQLVEKELNDEILIEMLKDSWRPSKVSAWTIGISKRLDLLTEILDKLNTSGIQYSEHLLLNLLILKENSGKQIESFVYQQIDYFLDTNNILTLENLSIDWAISILNYIDNKENTNIIQNILASEKWIEFNKKLKDLPHYEIIKESFEPNYFEEELNTLVEKIKSR